MQRVMVSFLGRGAEALGWRYRDAVYDFSGERYAHRYFGAALLAHLEEHGRRPERLLVLGTAGSSWHEPLAALGEDDLIDESLIRAVAEQRVTAADLAPFAGLSSGLGIEVTPLIIPDGRSETELLAIPGLLMRHAPRGAKLTLDATHGYRHLPLAGLVSALMLETLAGASVEAIYYAGLDMTAGGLTPVLRLDGVLSLVRWLEAVRVFDLTGEVGALADRIEQETGSTLSDDLAGLAFAEETTRLSDGFGLAAAVLQGLTRLEGPVASLIKPAIAERLDWARAGSRPERQARLALTLLARGRFNRASLMAFEAVAAELVERSRAGGGAHDREGLGADFNNLERGRRKARFPAERKLASAYLDLKDLRNGIAHAGPVSRPGAKAALRTETELGTFLRRIVTDVFPHLGPKSAGPTSGGKR